MNDPSWTRASSRNSWRSPRARGGGGARGGAAGGTAKYAVVNGDKKEREEDDGRPGARSARESAAEGEHNPDADAGAAGGARPGFPATTGRGMGREGRPRAGRRRARGGGRLDARGRRTRSDAGSRAESETTSPTSGGAAAAARVDRGAENASSGPGDGEGLARGDVREKRGRADRGHRVGDFVPIGKPRRALLRGWRRAEWPAAFEEPARSLLNSASRDNLAAMAEPAGPLARARAAAKGRSLDFRVKGRILEDKTLRLRLKIGDASGHTRTVEFPFNTDTDSSYSVASEMVDELQLAQSDIRTIMNEIENEVKFLNGEEENGGGRRAGAGAGGGLGTTSAQKARSSAPELGGTQRGRCLGIGGGSATDDPLAVAPRRAAVAAEGGVACARRRAAGGAGVPGDGAAGVSGRDRDTPPPPPAVIEAAVEARGARGGGARRGGGVLWRRR